MENRWNDLLIAFLHDPPDKALDIQGHVKRARDYIAVALGEAVQGKLGGVADQQAARAERLPAPHWIYAKVDPDGSLATFHGLSGQKQVLAVSSCDPAWVTGHIRDVVRMAGDEIEKRFLALWRRLPDKLAAEHPEYARLPADTRIPDHTIWNHLDITAGLQAAEVETTTGAAFLSFSLGPVQSFISAARTVRDLWSGSMILSHLAFQAMLPVIKRCGPTALIYPALRGVPALDLWLLRQKGFSDALLDEPEAARKLAPCLPNRFLAVVPYGPGGQVAQSLAEDCRKAVEDGWQRMADAVCRELGPRLVQISQDWNPSDRWQK